MSPTHNFKKTLEELDAFLKLPIQNDRDIAGIIQAFEFTFEQCWKSKANTYHPDERKQAEADYEHARQRYRSILAESSN